jgi:hypothetical protein
MIRKYAEFNTSQLPPDLVELLSRSPLLGSFSIPGFFVDARDDYGWDFHRDVSTENKSAYLELTRLLQENVDVMFARFDPGADESGLLPSFPDPLNDPPEDGEE